MAKSHKKSSNKIKSVGSKSQVWKGLAQHTTGGLTKAQITRVKKGDGFRYQSTKKMELGQKHPWTQAVKKARAELGVTGFIPLQKGTDLYKKAKEIYQENKAKKSSKKKSSKK